jgi:phage baseplate assembly protein gpV
MKKIFLLSALVLLTSLSLKSQNCGTCTQSINTHDTTSIVLNQGEILCIDTLGYFSGNITLNGGTICNKGFFKPAIITINSGTINNYSNVTIANSVNASATLIITNQDGSILNIAGSLTVNGGTISNNGILNVDQAITNTSGTFSNTNIINCTTITGQTTINNTGVINAN